MCVGIGMGHEQLLAEGGKGAAMERICCGISDGLWLTLLPDLAFARRCSARNGRS